MRSIEARKVEMLMNNFDLTPWVGTYTPLLDPVTGEIVEGLAGLDWSYITNLLLLLMLVSFFFTLCINIIKKMRW